MTPKRVIIMVLAIFLAGCSNVEDDWLKAKGEDTAQAYERFLKRHPNSPHESEAQKALSEIVFIPYLAFAGDNDDTPPLEKLKLPETFMSATSADKIFNATSFKMSGSIPWLLLNGNLIRLTSSHYDGRVIDTVLFGKLCCVLAQGGMGKAPYMIFYLGGTRAQRDALLAYVHGTTK